MSDEPPPVRCDDPSTWRHKGEKIDLPRLVQLIEENGGPDGLDLHGCIMTDINARPEALRPYVNAYAQKHGTDARPPWLGAPPECGIALSRAHLESARLIEAHLEHAVLIDARLENSFVQGAHLQNATLIHAHLENAYIVGGDLKSAHLVSAHLENATLWDADLEDAQLARAHLENADLATVRAHRARWYAAYLDRTRVRREGLGRAIGDELLAKGQARIHGEPLGWFCQARDAYMSLKTNFDSIGRYDDASWAYVKEQQMEKAMHFPTTAGHRWIEQRMGGALPPPCWGLFRVPGWLWWKLRSGFYHCRVFLGLCPDPVSEQVARREWYGRESDEWLSRRRWARNWAYELLTGYGEWPHMPLIWAAVVIAAFTGIYAGTGNIASGDGGGTHNFLTALTHSIGAFATIGFNTLEPQGWGARLLTAIEAMFGIGLFALFVFTLGNRMRRS